MWGLPARGPRRARPETGGASCETPIRNLQETSHGLFRLIICPSSLPSYRRRQDPPLTLLPAADDEDDDAIHGDDVNRAFRAAFVGVVARWSSRWRVVVGEVPGRRRHGGAGLRTCEDAA